MRKSALVSIIIPTYGGNIKLKRAIESALEQTYENIEIIVVDDNPPDSCERKRTENLMGMFKEKKNIHYIKHIENLNGAAARNTGIMNSKGEYITFLDDDDYFFPNRVEASVLALSKNPQTDIVFGDVIITGKNRIVTRLKVSVPEDVKKCIWNRSFSWGSGSNLFFSRKSIQKIGMFDIKFNRLQDVEYMLRFFEVFQAVSVSEVFIVKDSDGHNVPQYTKLKEMVELLESKFSHQLSRMNMEERKNAKLAYEKICIKAAIMNGTEADMYSEYETLAQLDNSAAEYKTKIKNYKLIRAKVFVFSKVRNFYVAKYLLSMQGECKARKILNSKEIKYIHSRYVWEE